MAEEAPWEERLAQELRQQHYEQEEAHGSEVEKLKAQYKADKTAWDSQQADVLAQASKQQHYEQQQAHDSEVEKLTAKADAIQKAADEQAEAASRVKSQAKALQEELQQAHTAGAAAL